MTVHCHPVTVYQILEEFISLLHLMPVEHYDCNRELSIRIHFTVRDIIKSELLLLKIRFNILSSQIT
jgi:hypothetical protein